VKPARESEVCRAVGGHGFPTGNSKSRYRKRLASCYYLRRRETRMRDRISDAHPPASSSPAVVESTGKVRVATAIRRGQGTATLKVVAPQLGRKSVHNKEEVMSRPKSKVESTQLSSRLIAKKVVPRILSDCASIVRDVAVLIEQVRSSLSVPPKGIKPMEGARQDSSGSGVKLPGATAPWKSRRERRAVAKARSVVSNPLTLSKVALELVKEQAEVGTAWTALMSEREVQDARDAEIVIPFEDLPRLLKPPVSAPEVTAVETSLPSMEASVSRPVVEMVMPPPPPPPPPPRGRLNPFLDAQYAGSNSGANSEVETGPHPDWPACHKGWLCVANRHHKVSRLPNWGSGG